MLSRHHISRVNFKSFVDNYILTENIAKISRTNFLSNSILKCIYHYLFIIMFALCLVLLRIIFHNFAENRLYCSYTGRFYNSAFDELSIFFSC